MLWPWHTDFAFAFAQQPLVVDGRDLLTFRICRKLSSFAHELLLPFNEESFLADRLPGVLACQGEVGDSWRCACCIWRASCLAASLQLTSRLLTCSLFFGSLQFTARTFPSPPQTCPLFPNCRRRASCQVHLDIREPNLGARGRRFG